MNIIQAFEDKEIFGRLIKNQVTWSSWKIALKAIFALPMTAEELEIYSKHTGRERPPSQPFKEVFLAVGRRGGKSFISAIIAIFLAVFRDWKGQLGPGETGYIMVVASDRKQASVVLGYIKAILRLKIFKGLVINETKEELELNNGITISVVTCSYRSIRGYSVVCAIADEVAFWRSEGANPDKEIFTALRPCMANIEGSLLIAISSTYAKAGILWEASQRFGQDDPEVLFWKAGTLDMNPKFKEKIIERALREDYTAARSEYFAEFREDLETFLSTEVIEASIISGRYELGKREGLEYFAFVDPSGGRGDAMTLSIVHREPSGKIIQDSLKAKKPPFNPEACVKDFCDVLKYYGIDQVTGDKYAGEWVSSSFEKQGISYESSELSKSELYLEFLPLLMQGKTELLDHKEQFFELRQLERRTGRGKDIVDHPPNLHDDCANALAGSVWLVAKEAEMGIGECIILDDGPSMPDWEKEMIMKNPKNFIAEEIKDNALEKFSTVENVAKFLRFSSEFKFVEDIAREWKIDPYFLRRWVSIKRDFINETAQDLRGIKKDEMTDEPVKI
jgi:hypothetical protein